MAANWDEKLAGRWDDAVKGSCDQFAGMLRYLLDELAAGSGIETCSVYIDLAKFYDNISLSKLLELAEKVQYPALALLLSLQAYLAPRYLRAQGFLSKPILPSGSTGAGCKRANSLACVILYDILNGLH